MDDFYTSVKIQIGNPTNSNNLDLSDHFPISVETGALKIVSYNVQLMPSIVGGVIGKISQEQIRKAVNAFTEYFARIDADVCCVQELFDDEANQMMTNSMRAKGYVSSERVGSDSVLSLFNGGVRTFVKKDLAHQLREYEYIYQNTIDYFFGVDAMVNKGISHISFRRDKIRYHIFNTHLQAYYLNREHYSEVTLMQCVELKKFIEAQRLERVIGSNDKIILCGDFNIPRFNNGEKNSFLFEKMKKLLGPQYIFLEYDIHSSGPQHTFSLHNSYNTDMSGSSDINVNLDMIIVGSSPDKYCVIESELSDIYCDIQRAISRYIKRHATIFSAWFLAAEKNNVLEQFNQRFSDLIAHAERIKNNNQNPIDNCEWYLTAVELLRGPDASFTKESVSKSTNSSAGNHVSAIESADRNNYVCQTNQLPDEESDISPLGPVVLNITQFKMKFDQLLYNLRKIHIGIHDNYINYGNEYKKFFDASLKLNHVLLNAGTKFFKTPSPDAYMVFQRVIAKQFEETEKILIGYSSVWEQIHPVFKSILGLIALFSVLPVLIFLATSPYSYRETFFNTPTPSLLQVKDEFNHEETPNLIF